jgi:oligoribonuclease NrnB/cAMP/cGMP phosphodiesterase (DHH superfamily)
MKMRIVARPDFDGVVCAVLLFEAEEITAPTLWLEPSDIHNGHPDIGSGDILCNLPYDDRCGMWFDHHFSNERPRSFKGAFKIAPSAAGVVFEYYKDRFKRDYTELVVATDKIDSADLTEEEVHHPEDYPYLLLSMTIGGAADTQMAYWNKLVDLLRHSDIGTVSADAEVKDRCLKTIEENADFGDLLRDHTEVRQQVSITDFRSLDWKPRGNRFLVYSLYPDTNVSVTIVRKDDDRERIIVKVGHSIFNRTCNVNAGMMLAEFGGGGHRGAGSCNFPAEDADVNIKTILDLLIANEANT